MKPRARQNRLGGWSATVRKGGSEYHGTGKTLCDAVKMARKRAEVAG